MQNNKFDTNIEPGLLIAMLMLLLFATPLTRWWASAGLPWFAPYLLWLLIIILCAVSYWRAHSR